MPTPPPAAPGDRPQAQPSSEPSSERRTPSLVVTVAVLAAGFVLLVCGAVAYIAWRHPAAAIPLGLAVALAAALIPLYVAAFRR